MKRQKKRLTMWVRMYAVLACLLLPALAKASEYHGQVVFGGIPVPGATVTVTQGSKDLSTITDSQGLYQFADLVDGVWKIHIEMRGFAPLDGDVTVSANVMQKAWELKMLPLKTMLALAEESPVKAPALQPHTSSLPGVAKAKSSKEAQADEPEPSKDDDEQASDGLLVNGSESNAATSKYSLSPAFGNQRSGTKALYNGSVGAMVSNSVFDARPYALTGLTLPKATYNRVTGVFTLGGPLKIPHLLPHGPNFFVGYQWTRNRDADTSAGLVPTDAERSGDLSGLVNALGQPITIYTPGTNVPIIGNISPTAQAAALLTYYPRSNITGDTRYNYETQVLSSSHSDSLQSRLDKTIGRRDTVYGGFAFNSVRGNNANLFHFVDTTNTFGINADVHWTHRFPYGVFANFGYTFSRLRTEVRPNFANRENVSGEAMIAGNNQDPINWGPPSLGFSGIASLNDAQSAFNRNRTDQLSTSAQWKHRKHNVTFGGDFRRQEFNEYGQQNPRGTFTFTGAATSGTGTASATTGSDLADFLLGVPDTSALAFGNADKYFRQSAYDLYATDDWRLRPELTINAGLRWDYGAPMTELFGRLVNLDIAPSFTAAKAVLGSNPKGSVTGQAYPTSLVRPDRLGFQPRIGVSWRPLPASTLVIRAGYGIYDDTSVYLSAAEFMAQQAPLSTSLSVSNSASCALTLAHGFRDCAGITPDTFAIDPNYRVGYAQTWQLAVQRDLPGALVMSATYLGVKGSNGLQEFLPNTYAPGGIDSYSGLTRGYVYRASTGSSNRQSGQVQLRRRLRSGIAANVQYTYSKSLDNDSLVGAQGHITTAATTTGTDSATTPTIAQNWLDLRNGEHGLSTFDQRHLLTAQLQYTSGMGLHGGTLLDGWRGRLLKDWTASITISAGSGLPETPVYNEVVPGTGVTGTIRPDVTGAPIHRIASTLAGYFLNSSSYAAPASGQWGNARRGSITGPGQFTLDGALARTFQLHNAKSFDMRVDATNLLNHVVFTAWNTTTNSTTFGLPAGVKAMRSLQLTGRFRF